MSQQPPQGYGQPPRHHRNWAARHKLITGVAVTASLIVIGAIAAAASGAGSHPARATPPPSRTAVAPVAATAPARHSSPAATPSPDGTYQGACDYDLGDNPAGGTGAATGDIDTTNTGNIGIKIRLTITWPQEGYASLSQSKTVRLAPGHESDVMFHLPLSYDQLDRLQNWQADHDYKDGCTYAGKITGVFGAVSG